MNPYSIIRKAKGEIDEWGIQRFFAAYSKISYSSFFSRFDLWHPHTDIYETEEEFVIICDIAGVDKESLYILLDGNVLHIKGERKEDIPPVSVIFHDIEILYGPFERVITLPKDIVVSDTKAVYKDGLLKIYLHKGKSVDQPKRDIKVE
jgi:HSP20 family protein